MDGGTGESGSGFGGEVVVDEDSGRGRTVYVELVRRGAGGRRN